MRNKFLLVLLIACVALIGCEKAAEARGRKCKTETVAVNEDDHNVGGVKIDAPNLVNIDDEGKWTLGVEGGKDVIRDIFYDADERFFEADKGYFVYVKVTYKGCLLNCNEE